VNCATLASDSDVLLFQKNLKQCLSVRLPQLLTQRNIRLVVVDSIAGLFRADYGPSDAINRAKDLQIVGGQLHKLAQQFHLAVICVNQVP
jgi:RecA/RadA recombinase